MALADDFKNAAIAWKVANAQREKAEAEARINELGGFAQAEINSRGALYIQIPNRDEFAPTYRAILTKYGKEYLQGLGFRVESTPQHADIWWADPDEVERAVDLILNPPPVPEVIPENENPPPIVPDATEGAPIKLP